MAGLAGALFASSAGTISGVGFGAFLSLTLVAVLTIAGRGEIVVGVHRRGGLVVVPSLRHVGDLSGVPAGRSSAALALYAATRDRPAPAGWTARLRGTVPATAATPPSTAPDRARRLAVASDARPGSTMP